MIKQELTPMEEQSIFNAAFEYRYAGKELSWGLITAIINRRLDVKYNVNKVRQVCGRLHREFVVKRGNQ